MIRIESYTIYNNGILLFKLTKYKYELPKSEALLKVL